MAAADGTRKVLKYADRRRAAAELRVRLLFPPQQPLECCPRIEQAMSPALLRKHHSPGIYQDKRPRYLITWDMTQSAYAGGRHC